jgi:hypothetical protein
MEPVSMLMYWIASVALFALKMFIAGLALVAGAGIAMKKLMK